MKNLNTYIHEKLTIVHKKSYSCAPQTKEDLIDIIKERLKKDQNADLNDIDVSRITDMGVLFAELNSAALLSTVSSATSSAVIASVALFL